MLRNMKGMSQEQIAEVIGISRQSYAKWEQEMCIRDRACTQYYEDGRKINDEIMAQAMEGVAWMEKENEMCIRDRVEDTGRQRQPVQHTAMLRHLYLR